MKFRNERLIPTEYKKRCGILDKTQKEDYTRIIKLYLEKLERVIAVENQEDISFSIRRKMFAIIKNKIRIFEGDNKAEHIENLIADQLAGSVFTKRDVAKMSHALHHLNLIRDEPLNSDYQRTHLTKNFL